MNHHRDHSWRAAHLTTVSLLVVCLGLVRGMAAEPTSQPASQPVPKLSPAEQLATSLRYLKEIKSLLLETAELAKQAKRNRDAVKHNCLLQYAQLILAAGKRAARDHDRLVQGSKGHITRAVTVLEGRDEPPASSETAATVAKKEDVFPMIFASRQRAERLAVEARACTGQMTAKVYDTALPPDKPSDPGPWSLLPFKPPLASPARPE